MNLADDPLAEVTYGIDESPDPEETSEETSSPRPYVRFLARSVDMNIWGLCYCVGLLFLFAFLPSTVAADINPILLGIPALALWVPVESVLLAAWGMTPGKWLLRTRVRARAGGPPTFGASILRSLLVWTVGMGVGIPCLQLIGMFAASWRLEKKGLTLWDQASDCEVLHRDIGSLRVTIGILFVLAVFALYIALRILLDPT